MWNRVKQIVFFMQQKKHFMHLKNLKNLDLKNQKKSCKIIILRAKHFNLYYFLFLFQINRSKDKGVRRLFSKSINKKSIIEFNILNLC